MIYCPKYRLNLNEDSECIHCKWNLPITFNLKVNCTCPRQFEWTEDFKTTKIK